jgi:hypothetical protein
MLAVVVLPVPMVVVPVVPDPLPAPEVVEPALVLLEVAAVVPPDEPLVVLSGDFGPEQAPINAQTNTSAAVRRMRKGS